MFDVVVVLAGGITNDGSLPKSVQERVQLAQKLYRFGYCKNILFSGKWSSYWENIPQPKTEAQLMSEYALFLDVPQKCHFLEEHSSNTKENIFYSYKLFVEPQKWSRVLVITSDFHVNRVQQKIPEIFPSGIFVSVLGVPSSAHFLRSLYRSSKEGLLLLSHWLFHNFLYRR